jgi:hypothetical protein
VTPVTTIASVGILARAVQHRQVDLPLVPAIRLDLPGVEAGVPTNLFHRTMAAAWAISRLEVGSDSILNDHSKIADPVAQGA